MLSYSSLSKTILCYKTYRCFTTSNYLSKKLPPNKNPFNKKKPGWILNMFNTIKNPTKGLGVIWLPKGGKDVRPSDEEILEKKLPANTPSLKHRIMRDYEHKFFEEDKDGGYHKGELGTYIRTPWRDLVDANATVGDICKHWKKGVKHNTQYSWKQFKDYQPFTGARTAQRRFDNAEPGNSQPIENCNFLEEGVTNEQLPDDFTISSDSEWGEGYSWGAVEAGPTSKSIIFYGDLNTTVPRDGRTARAGFVNIKQNPMLAAFGSRKKHLPFETYNAVTLKIRGDGRVYWINVHREKEKRYDVNWMDLDTYPLITRGGPYWQDVIIPYSKFLNTYKGHLQDKRKAGDMVWTRANMEKIGETRAYLPLMNMPNWLDVENVSISLMDRIDGPFRLEIAQIGLLYLDLPDKAFETDVYEDYRLPSKFYVGSHI